MNQEQATEYLNNLLKIMLSKEASDLFISENFPPSIKVHGEMTAVSDQKLSSIHTRAIANAAMNEQ